MAADRELSVFVDESGSFDSSVIPSRFYLITLVFHDQSESIAKLVEELESQLAYLGHPGICIHSGPLIRREEVFAHMDITMRRKLFGRIVAFARRAPVRYRTFCVDKRFCDTPEAMKSALSRQISGYFSENTESLAAYKSIKVFYDNGQPQVGAILKGALPDPRVSFPSNVTPERYRLFQVADLVCTVELLKAKLAADLPLTRSEAYFFNGVRELKKNYIRPLARIRG